MYALPHFPHSVAQYRRSVGLRDTHQTLAIDFNDLIVDPHSALTQAQSITVMLSQLIYTKLNKI
jgi:hypothetical protein